MSIRVDKHELEDGKFDVDITCEVCGGPITHSDKYGMWCDKECGREMSIKASKEFREEMDSLINGFTNLIEKKGE